MTATPSTETAPTAAHETPSPLSTTPGNVVPLTGRVHLYGNETGRSLHASPRYLRTLRRDLIDDLRRFTRGSKNETARRMLAKLNGCGTTPIGKGISLVRHTADGKVIGGTVRGVRTCKDRSCPVCAAAIEGKEARDTRAALLYMHHTGTLDGHKLILFTATLRHAFHDDHARNWQNLRTVLSKLLNADWWKGKPAREGRKAVPASVAGALVKLEIEGTLDDPRKAGLHPHAHILLAVPVTVDADKLAAKVQDFFKAEFGKLCPGENRIGWHRDKGETWWKEVSTDNLPLYLAKKRWSIAEEVTASGAKNGGFWNRPVGDLVAVWGLTEGVPMVRRTGVFRDALAAVRKLTPENTAAVTVARMGNEEWSALTPENRDALSAALENPAADPAWIAWTVANMHAMAPAALETFLALLNQSKVPPQAIDALIAAAPGLTPSEWFGLVVETAALALHAA